MKKGLFSVLLLLSLLLLIGCQAAPEQQLSLEEMARQYFSGPDAFIAYTAEDLEDLTGIAPDDYTEAVFLRDSDTLSGREIILVRTKDAEAFRGAKQALERYLSQRKEETRDYLPEAFQRLNQATVEGTGMLVRLVVE